MKQAIRWCLALGLLLWLTRLLMASFTGSVTPPTIGEILQRADLVVLEAPMESMCVKQRAGLVGGVELVLIARGSVLISTDLSKARYCQIDESSKQATIALPLPTALWARLDSQKSNVYKLSRYGLWFMVLGDAGESELMELAWREAEQGFAQKAADPALIKQARQQAEKVIAQLFAKSGWSVNVIWQ